MKRLAGMSGQGAVDLGDPLGGEGPFEPGMPDGVVVGPCAEAGESRSAASSRAGPLREVGEPEPDPVVVGGVAGGLLEHDEGPLDRYGLDVEQPEIAENPDWIRNLKQFLAEQVAGLVPAVFEAEHATEKLPCLGRLSPADAEDAPEQDLGIGEAAPIQEDRRDPEGREARVGRIGAIRSQARTAASRRPPACSQSPSPNAASPSCGDQSRTPE